MSEVITFYENKKKRNYRNKICGSNFVGISGEIIFNIEIKYTII